MMDRTSPAKALMEDLTVTVEDAAKLMAISRNSAYAAVRDGSLPSIRVGRAIRLPTAKLREMLGIGHQTAA